jgi:hypothetical protein
MTIDMLVQFEDRIILEQEMAQIALPATASVEDPNLGGSGGTLAPVIVFPDEIKLNEFNQIQVTNLQDRQRIVLSDGNVATFDPESLLVTARRLGCFEIQVLDRRFRQTDGAALAPIVVASKSVNVVL